MLCPPTSIRSQCSSIRWSDTGGMRFGAAASVAGLPGSGCIGSPDAGSRERVFSIPGRRCASTFLPEAGAQCVSSARWDLSGGRPEPLKGKGCPYRDHQLITHHRPPRTARTERLPRRRVRACAGVAPDSPRARALAGALPPLGGRCVGPWIPLRVKFFQPECQGVRTCNPAQLM